MVQIQLSDILYLHIHFKEQVVMLVLLITNRVHSLNIHLS